MTTIDRLEANGIPVTAMAGAGSSGGKNNSGGGPGGHGNPGATGSQGQPGTVSGKAAQITVMPV